MDTTVWRWFPIGLIGVMGLVFAINGVMIYDAVQTFPGAAGEDGFDLSNEYKRVLAAAERQAALGWQIEAEVTPAHFPVLRLTDRSGAPLAPVAIEAHAERPIGPLDSTALQFHPVGDGKFQADTSLFSGQWDIMLTVRSNDGRYRATRRVIVK